jgi:single-stranded-DNA-specific exonuclease
MPNRPESRWYVPDVLPREVLDSLLTLNLPEAFCQILYNRKIHTKEEARNYLAAFHEEGDPFLMKGMDSGVDRILSAIDLGEKIAVYGDYDVDGVTATALLTQVVQKLGGYVISHIPNRFEEGYGLNCEAIESLAGDSVQLLVTVDCGIRSPGECEFAKEKGIDVVISDHHHPLEGIVPEVTSVICPKQPGDLYPDKNLAGVGLAYKIAQGLLLRRPLENVQADDWIDLVAIGTVADIVPLVGENRAMVRRGLEKIRKDPRLGVYALAQVASIKLDRISASDIGYGLGPRLNAAGRLESALDAFYLLVSTDENEAGLLAQKLDDQNRQRQELTRSMQDTAIEQAKAYPEGNLIFAVDKSFNEGVVGLVAAKLTEAYYLPAIVGAQKEEFTRASCRSIPEFHITQALDECKDLLVRHGGHSMAAGLTVRNDKLAELTERLNAIAERQLGELDLRPLMRADVEIPLSDLKPDLLKYLNQLQPTGSENPDAVFVSRGLGVKGCRKVGSDGSHLKLTVSDGRITYDAIAFRKGDWADRMPKLIDLMYTYETNYFNGRESLQLKVRDLKSSEEVI